MKQQGAKNKAKQQELIKEDRTYTQATKNEKDQNNNTDSINQLLQTIMEKNRRTE